MSLADARKKLENCRKYYNEERPHGAIGDKAWIRLLNHGGAASSSPCKGRKTPPAGGPANGFASNPPRLESPLGESSVAGQTQ
jgi:transposase InsO family protein